mgnify:CR=1 FL=1
MTFHGERWTWNEIIKVFKWAYKRDWAELSPTSFDKIPKYFWYVLKHQKKSAWMKIIKTIPVAIARHERECFIDGCKNMVDGKKYCHYHYNKLNLYGNLNFSMNGWTIGK